MGLFSSCCSSVWTVFKLLDNVASAPSFLAAACSWQLRTHPHPVPARNVLGQSGSLFGQGSQTGKGDGSPAVVILTARVEIENISLTIHSLRAVWLSPELLSHIRRRLIDAF